MNEKRFTSWGNRIKRNGKLLNIEFKTKTDAKLCCKLCNQMDKHQQEYIDELNEIFKWYKEYYGETILDTRMGWNDNNKISKLEKENEQLKQQVAFLEEFLKTGVQYEYYQKVYDENEQLKQSIKEIDEAELHLKQIILKRIDDYIWEWEDEGTPVAQVLRELRDEIKGDVE